MTDTDRHTCDEHRFLDPSYTIAPKGAINMMFFEYAAKSWEPYSAAELESPYAAVDVAARCGGVRVRYSRGVRGMR